MNVFSRRHISYVLSSFMGLSPKAHGVPSKVLCYMLPLNWVVIGLSPPSTDPVSNLNFYFFLVVAAGANHNKYCSISSINT